MLCKSCLGSALGFGGCQDLEREEILGSTRGKKPLTFNQATLGSDASVSSHFTTVNNWVSQLQLD